MSSIEWTDVTWNPTVGCSRVSPGCDNCYAINVAHRALQPAHEGLTIHRPGERTDWTGEVRQLPDRLDTPLRWRKPRRVFVDSMSDLFHQDLPVKFVADVFAVMAVARQHTFQVLTKRPQRMAGMLRTDEFRQLVDEAMTGEPGAHSHIETADVGWPLPNVWFGSSIESDRFSFRATWLRGTPAAVRFLSLEPLLGPLPSLDLEGIDWVIAGGESGPGARPCDPAWVRDIRDRCEAGGVRFFFKQWGTWLPYEPDPQPPFWMSQTGDMVDGHVLPADLSEHDPTGGWWWPAGGIDSDAIYRKAGKRAAGRELDGRTWDEIPAPKRSAVLR